MAAHNRVILIGNLTRDVELRKTPGGTSVADVGLAINERRKEQSGEWVDSVTFVDVTLWGRTAEVASEFLHKGSSLFVEGRLRLDTWETDGQKRSKMRVICEKMQMIGGRGDEGGRSSGSSSMARNVVAAPGDYYESDGAAHADDFETPGQRDSQPTGAGAGYNDDDIPF